MHLKRLYKALAIVITVAMILPQTWVSTFAEGEVVTVEAEATSEPDPTVPATEEPEQETPSPVVPAPETPKPEPTAPTDPPVVTDVPPSTEPTATPEATEEPSGTPEPNLTPEISETPVPSETPDPSETPSVTPSKTPQPSKTPSGTPTGVPTGASTDASGATQAPESGAVNGYGSNSALIAAQQIVMPPITVDSYRFTTIEKVYAVAKENIIVREEQDVESREIGKLAADGLCFIIKDIENSEWAYIESDDVRGFVKTEYLTMGIEAIQIVNEISEENMELAVATVSPEDNKAFAYIRETVYETKIEKTYAIANVDVKILEGIISSDTTKVDTTEEDTTEEDTTEEVTTAEDTTEEDTTAEETTEEDTTAEEETTAEDTTEEDATAEEDTTEEDTTEADTTEEDKNEEPRVIGELPEGGICYVLATQGEWLFVESDDVRGFVKADQLIVGAEAEEQLAEGSDWTEEQATALAEAEAALSQLKSDQATDELNKQQAEVTLAAASDDTDATTLQEVEDAIAELESSIAETEKAIEAQTTVVSEAKAEKNGMFGKNIADAPKVTELVKPEDNKAFYYTLASTKEISVSDSIGRAMIEFASQFLGNPYVWGGTSLTNGADCSGFVQGIYSQFGYSIPRTSGEQSQVGMQIPVSEARTGDLIFYARNGVIYHVVMYIDNGQVIHASSRKTGIITSGIDVEHAVWATRMISDEDMDKVEAVNAKAGLMMYGGAYTNATAADKGELLGNFKLTAYCNCVICCGKWAGGPTASGTAPVEGRTVAMAGVPFGTKLIIDGKIYTVEDRGTPYGHVDIYMNSHDECNQFGVQYTDVYTVK